MALTNAAMENLVSVEGLHSDLGLLANQQFTVIDRLLADLDTHVEALRKLLDRTPKSEEARKQLASGKFKFEDEEYELNEEFRISTLELSDALDLNESEAATLLFEAQNAADELNRTPVATAVIRFHTYRSFLVDCLRLLLKIIVDDECEEGLKLELQKRLESIIKAPGQRGAGSAYTQKCLSTMLKIEQWLNRISDQIQRMITVGQVSNANQDEVMGIQQQNLGMQHESLGAIVTYLIKLGYTSIDDLKKLLQQLQQLDKWNTLVIHYVPSIIAFFSIYGSAHGTAAHADSRVVYKSLISGLDGNAWPLRQFHGAIVVWWLAEYNSWYFDLPDDHVAIEDENSAKETTARAEALSKALGNGAFQCVLSICSQMRSSDWYDPARLGLIRNLLNDAFVLPQESAAISNWFIQLVFEHVEFFTFSFIQNMPNTLRDFKTNEEDQRRQYLNSLSLNMQNDIAEPDRHLERFFVIMSYAYEGRPEAAKAFWEDTDSHLYGFLQWFSRRVSTPLVGAFCEMFRAISEGEEFANAAHNFLSDASQAATSRARRASCLSWEQIFEELEFYAAKIRDSPVSASATTTYGTGKTKIVDIDEPETPVMLESYLRLVSHLCQHSEIVRNWLLTQTRCKFVETVFQLSNGSIASRVRSCTYSVLSGLLSARTVDVNTLVWNSLDQWVSTGFPSTRPSRTANTVSWAGDVTFDAITTDFEEMSAFVDLMNALITPPFTAQLYDGLCFPESLGSSYRMPGIDPYVDLVLGKILAQKALSFDHLKARILCSKIFRFVRTAFDSFNERLLLLAQKTGQSLDDAIEASSLLAYIQLHPFSRIMEWMFNEKVLTVLFSMAHQDISEISASLPEAPINAALLGSIDVMNCIMQLQTTYLDIVRPLLKTQSAIRRQPASNPSLASYEDAVSVHLRVITDLAYYAGTCNEELALPALQLLKQFSKSRKLNSTQASKISSHVLSNRLIGILQANNDVDPISKALGDLLDWDEREVEGGAASPRFKIKFAVLNFVEEALQANAEAPNVAHSLLGFQCTGLTVSVEDGSAFAKHTSLFHKIVRVGLDYPSAVDGSMDFAMMNLKTKALNIIHMLWSARLTSGLVLRALTEFPFLDILWLATPLVDPSTLWQGLVCQDQDFLFSDAARTLQCLLKQRQFIYSHVASQMRLLAHEDSIVARSQLVATIFGSNTATGEVQQTASIFDLLDFLELEVSEQPISISAPLLGDFDIFESCKITDASGVSIFDLELVEELLSLKMNHLQRAQTVPDPALDERLGIEKDDILGCLNGINNQETTKRCRISTLRAWADLVIIVIEQGGLEESEKASVAVQALRIISPKLVLLAGVNTPETHVFAHLAQGLVGKIDLTSTTMSSGRTGEMARERLFELFKICLRAISNPDTSNSLRDSYYDICSRYLLSISSQRESSRTNTMQTIRKAGEIVIETISEDAYGAAGTSSIGALLLLDALTRLAMEENSSYVIETLAHNNFIAVLIHSIQGMLGELDRAGKADIPLLLTNYKAKLGLVLTISSTRTGANIITSAGFFNSIRASGLFNADPDLGLDLDNPAALQQFYELVLAVLRIVAATVLSRGPQNKQTIDQARSFLQSHRALLVGVLKRESKVVKYAQDIQNGHDAAGLEKVLEELVEVYMVIVAATGYLEHEDESARSQASVRGRFS